VQSAFFFNLKEKKSFFFFLYLKKSNLKPFFPLSKGKQVKIPAPNQGLFCGNANEPWETGASPGKSSLFFLTVYSL